MAYTVATETLLRYGGRGGQAAGLEWDGFGRRPLTASYAGDGRQVQKETLRGRAAGFGEGLGTRERPSDASATRPSPRAMDPQTSGAKRCPPRLRRSSSRSVTLLASQAGAGLAAKRRPFYSGDWFCTDPPSVET